MLPNTTIVPDTDAKLAASLIKDAVDALDVILMLVFGKNDLARQGVEWADQLANRMPADGGTVRRVLWIRFPSRDQTPRSVLNVLDPILGTDEFPLVAVLNFHDELKGTMSRADTIRPLTLERLFVRGNEV